MECFKSLLALLAVSGATSEQLHGTQLHCVGGAAHMVTYSLGQTAADTAISIAPAPDSNAECRAGIDRDRHICIGVNQESSCASARQPSIPLPGTARCQGCFLGVETDFFYALNVSRLRVQHVGVGFRGTQLRSQIFVVDDEGKAGAKKGSVAWGDQPLEWKLRVAGRVLVDLKISTPTEAYYEFHSAEGGHVDAGAELAIDLGENSVQYTSGKGWEHRSDEVKVSMNPMVEGDYNSHANLTVGLKSSLQVEIKDVLWFHVNMSPEMPLLLTSVGTSGAGLIHTCGIAGLNFDAGHEADVHINFRNRTLEKHLGPTADRHYHNSTLASKCVDVRPLEPAFVV